MFANLDSVRLAPDQLLTSNSMHLLVKSDFVQQTMTAFAGNGEPGFVDGPRLQARFNRPVALSQDSAGNIYVADRGNYAIRKLTPAGDVSTVYQIPAALRAGQ